MEPVATRVEVGYARRMTQALTAAFARLATLPAEEQDRIAKWLLAEIADDERWTGQFSGSEDALKALADEARADHAAGRTTDLDPDKM